LKRQLLLILLLFSPLLQADEVRYYDVELIIFEHLQAGARNSEQWPEKLNREMPERLVEIGGPWPGERPEAYLPALSFTPLPVSQWRLTAEAEKIENSASRRLLAHQAWVQPGLPQEEAISVHFNQRILPPQTPVPDTGETTENMQTPALDSGTLDVLIRVSLARYLRVETDLLFTLDEPPVQESMMQMDAKAENETETRPAPHYFHVQQLRRRIRSTELHYLDHPVLGMLIMFTPHEVEDKATVKKK